MKVSKRQRQIIDFLLGRQDEVTAAEIAGEINVSARTVHRELADVEAVLRQAGISLVRRSGFGIRLEGSPEKLEALKQSLTPPEKGHHTSEERKVLILGWLLSGSEPVKLFSLAHDLRVAVPTVTADLDELVEGLREKGLNLERRRGFGVHIDGPEPAMRRAIAELIREHMSDSELFGRRDSAAADPVIRLLLSLLGKDDVFFRVEKALWHLETRWPKKLPEAEYTLLLIRLSVALTRIREGKLVEPREEASGEEPADPDDKIGYFLGFLEMPVPPAERAFLARELACWDNPYRELDDRLLPGDLQLAESAVRLIRFMEERLGIGLLQDRSLMNGLVHHMRHSLQRIRDGTVIRNPLLTQIRKKYESLFDLVRQAMTRTYPDLAVPDEEIGFLVLHFGVSLERAKEFPRNVRALLVCTSGIGSSKMLAVRINKELPQIELIGRASWFEASRYPEDQYDLIISTVDLPVDPSRYIKLSPLLTKDETEKLRTFIQTITLKETAQVSRTGDAAHDSDMLLRLRNVKKYAEEIIHLIEHFEVYAEEIPPGGTDLRSVLYRLCGRAELQGGLTDVEPVVQQLIDREAQGSQLLSDTELALFHTRSTAVPRPYLSLFRLSEPLYLKSDSGEEQPVHHILFMLAPREISKESLEILSEISGLLLSPELISLLQAGDKDPIKQFFSRELEQFLQLKMEWRVSS
ncbi:BglG family transcription antiterminator [Paenibacillus chitinolyticus]|uniref:BglG family transcription antiterminator n=1 Tax=Paenibacillus chitinolyticus TaxID=79263 RepID=UPI003866A2FB